MSSTSASSREQAVIDAVSADRLMESDRAIAQWVRLSGTDEEANAFDWIQQQLESYGLETHRYRHPGLVSWPESATLTVTPAGGSAQTLTCSTHAFATATGPAGISGELVYVGRGTPEDFAGKDVRGRIVLVDGIIAPNRNLAVEAAGVAASIWIAGTHLHERALSPVWGTPTPETANLLPKTPSVSIPGTEGERLRALMAQGPVTVHMVTQVYRAWRQLPCLTGDLRPSAEGPESDTFVMFSGHVDSWYYGAMDNGTANATQLEVARIIAEHQDELRRGLRVAFWSGHSHARYAGSTWYADNFWQDLHDRCVAHVNVDSVGGNGATVLSEGNSMAELREFTSDVIEQIAGQRLAPRRYGRSGDQSFWGHGFPSVLMSLSEQPAANADPLLLALHHQISGGQGAGGGLGWWWHTPEDTVDKIDPAFLERDATIYALLVYRLCTARVLPFDYGADLAELHTSVDAVRAKAGDAVDLSDVGEWIGELGSSLDRLSRRVSELDAVGRLDDASVARVNRCLMEVGRALIPVDYSRGGQFDHDLAVPTQPVPGLQPATRLATLQPGTDDYEFLRTRVVRERNRLVHALVTATRAVEASLNELG
ncbi:MAG TPA: M28 family peptidase [Thermomicrobiaceae bacterium]|nr:M28 family peptidase [Thermomicrobiaceae bacterium]